VPRYNPRVDLITGSPTRRIDALRERLAREGRDVILLSTGQPGFLPPRRLREILASMLMDDGDLKLYSYTPTPGFYEAREAVAEDLRDLGGPKVSPEQVVLTAGGQEAMFAALSSIIEPGDRVVLFDPTYFGYKPLVEYLGGSVVWVRAPVDTGYQPDEEELKAAVEDRRVKAIIVVTPDNPTGRLLSRESARLIADLAVDRGIWVVADEAYKTLVYEGEHVWLYEMAPDNTISINTFSKDPGFPGWRLGYVYGPEWIVSKIRLVSEEVVYCPPSFAQRAVTVYLRDRRLRREHIEAARRFMVERRDAMVEALREHIPGARFVKPGGSMFVMADLEEYLAPAGVDSEALASRLLEEEGVAVIPGKFFGPGSGLRVRLSFATETPERIREGVRRMASLLERLPSRP
jgi:aspartate aminotransferase